MLSETEREARFWAKVDRSGGEDACWPWMAYKSKEGYGDTGLIPGTKKAHRAAYILLCGPVVKELTLDHLCRNRYCCNPKHLEPVTIGVNTRRGEGPAGKNARKTHCIRGHALEGYNLITSSDGYRHCRECKNLNDRERDRLVASLRPLRIRLTCRQGHVLAEQRPRERLYTTDDGIVKTGIRCRVCDTTRQRELRERKREAS